MILRYQVILLVISTSVLAISAQERRRQGNYLKKKAFLEGRKNLASDRLREKVQPPEDLPLADEGILTKEQEEIDNLAKGIPHHTEEFDDDIETLTNRQPRIQGKQEEAPAEDEETAKDEGEEEKTFNYHDVFHTYNFLKNKSIDLGVHLPDTHHRVPKGYGQDLYITGYGYPKGFTYYYPKVGHPHAGYYHPSHHHHHSQNHHHEGYHPNPHGAYHPHHFGIPFSPPAYTNPCNPFPAYQPPPFPHYGRAVPFGYNMQPYHSNVGHAYGTLQYSPYFSHTG